LAVVLHSGAWADPPSEPITIQFQIDTSAPLILPNYLPAGTDQNLLHLDILSVLTEHGCGDTWMCSIQIDSEGKVSHCAGAASNCQCVKTCPTAAGPVMDIIDSYRE